MDHSITEAHHAIPAPDGYHAMPRLRRRLSEIRSYGYRPTEAKLTGQQLLIAQLTALGLANKEIAYLADISETTVKAHISAALRSLNLKRRTQLCRYIFEGRLLGGE
ncbi:response regulator transcription factor [Nordella sp. HKS 07]|uniref:response regulator transcription factor n=1 Tax=Nordella sp. HKS 07 TaxID=2712222 RepID=UPI0013E10E8C|nr:LuxR C-terminal-related transcriptional regulator [Nordella sp. HKS 07]QIG47301.1 response regulator transcription factor [Nordella sp. HKS 07]